MANSIIFQYSDPVALSHVPLIKSPGVIKIGDIYHDPRFGLNILLSKGIDNRIEWHEAAHSFITQKSALGLINNFISDAISELSQRLIDLMINRKYVEPFLIYSIKRLFIIRYSLSYYFLFFHELFAMSFERIMIIKNFKEELIDFYTHPDLKTDKLGDFLFKLHKYQYKNGDREHKITLKLLEDLFVKFGDFSYGYLFSEWALFVLPLLLSKQEPSSFLYGNLDNVINNLPNPSNLTKSILINPINCKKGPYVYIQHFISSLIKRAKTLDEYKDLFSISLDNLVLRLDSILELLPLEDWRRDHLHLVTSYSLFSDLSKDIDNIRDNYYSINDSSTKTQYPSEKIYKSIFNLSPPFSLKYENGGFTLFVRKDLMNHDALSYMANRNIITDFLESIFEQENSKRKRYHFCFIGCTISDSTLCDTRQSSCGVLDKFSMLAKTKEFLKKSVSDQYLFCAKDNKLKLFLLSDSYNNSSCLVEFPLNIVETELSLY